jgi:twitching motility two-component system response regulator PilG
MNQVSSSSRTTSENLHPISWLENLSNTQADGCLQVSNSSVSWLIYLAKGKLTYATHSIEFFDRLDRHLRRLSYQVPSLTNAVRAQVRFELKADLKNHSTQNFEYQAICWLVEQQYLNSTQAATLVEQLTKEVIESYLPLKQGAYNFVAQLDESPQFCRLDLQPVIEECRMRLRAWQALRPKVWSPYQRPYFFSQVQAQQQLSLEQQQRLGNILKGFSFRHLAVLLNQDELKLAQHLYPFIVNGTILLRNPQPPFDQLPIIPDRLLESISSVIANSSVVVNPDISLASIPTTSFSQRKHSIACIDDSPAMLNEINRFLEDQNLSVFMINDSVKALVEIIRIKPDLILLDVGMPMVDGYKLCRLIRNHSLFKTTPVVMVTGNTGIIDRAKAKLVGATDYMTKPFTQSELLKMVFRYLT